MSEVVLPGRPPGASVAPLGASTAPGTISDPPAGLVRLGPGSLVKGEVVGRNEAGQTLIKTDLGTLAVATRQVLPPGREVVLQIRAAGSELHVAILPAHPKGGGKEGAPPPPPAQPGAPQSSGQPAPQGGAQPPATNQPPVSGAPPRAPAGSLPLPPGIGEPGGSPGQIQQAPPSVARLTSGALLPATVLGREADGQVLLRTELGTLTLSTEARLARGAAVLLQVKAAVPDLQVQVLPATAGDRASPAQGGAQAQPSAPAAADRLVVGQPVRATVVPAPFAIAASNLAATGQAPAPSVLQGSAPQNAAQPVAPQSATPAPPLPSGLLAAQTAPQSSAASSAAAAPSSGAAQPLGQAGAPLAKLTVTGTAPTPLALSEAGKALLQAVSQPGSPAQAGVARAAPATSVQAAAPQLPPSGPALPQGSEISLRVVSLQAPDRTAPGAAAPASPASAAVALRPGETTLQATVVGRTASGQPILETAAGVLRLAQPTALAEGTRLTLALSQAAFQGPHAALAGEPPPPGTPAQLMHSWPALQSLLGLFDQGEPAILREAAERLLPGPSIPQTGPRLASGLLFLLSAFAGGDPGQWLQGLYQGRAQKLMERDGRGDLLSRLRGDLATMGRLQDAAGPDWRFLPLPFHDGQQVQQLRLFLRRKPQGPRKPEEDATRFVLDVDMTRFGALQFDGLIRPKRFDMVLRSREAFPGWMRADILGLFEQANEIAGAQGQLRFQASPGWEPVEIHAPREAEGVMA